MGFCSFVSSLSPTSLLHLLAFLKPSVPSAYVLGMNDEGMAPKRPDNNSSFLQLRESFLRETFRRRHSYLSYDTFFLV